MPTLGEFSSDKTMALEPFDIEIGDYVAIAALAVSLFVFLLGYSRTRKSE